MRLGGARRSCKSVVPARRVVAALVMLAGGFAAGAGTTAGAAQSAKATDRLWAMTRDDAGRMHVVRGMSAAIAEMDNRLGRRSAHVLSSEQDTTVRVLNGPDLQSQQWAFAAVDFGSAWQISTGAGIKVAVIDTGVLASHEDLVGSVLPGIDLAADAAYKDPSGQGGV